MIILAVNDQADQHVQPKCLYFHYDNGYRKTGMTERTKVGHTTQEYHYSKL